MLATLNRGDFGYDILLWIHILTAIVGFGSTFVWPALASRSRKLGNPVVSLEVSRMSLDLGHVLTTYFVYAVGVTGLILFGIGPWHTEAVSKTWIGIAILLYAIALTISLGFHLPNLRAMLGLQEELGAMGPPPQSAGAAAGGPPPQVLELQERGKRAGMYGGILHLLFALILLDMVFKPGFLYFH